MSKQRPEISLERRGAILDSIERLTRERNGIPPTFREVGLASGFASASAVFERLKTMRDDGLVIWEDGQVRTLRVIKQSEAA